MNNFIDDDFEEFVGDENEEAEEPVHAIRNEFSNEANDDQGNEIRDEFSNEESDDFKFSTHINEDFK